MADVSLTYLHVNDVQRALISSALALGHRVMVRTVDITSAAVAVSVVASEERYTRRACPLCSAITPGNIDECIVCDQPIGFGEPLVEVARPIVVPA